MPEDRRLEAAIYSGIEEGRVEILRLQLGHGPVITPQTVIHLEAVRDYFAPEGDALRVAFFDPAMHVPGIINAINRDANFSEVLEPFSPRELVESEVADVSYIAGRDYERVLIYEVEGVPGLGVFPYFQVQVSGVEYTSEAMGFGEHALLLGYWVLTRMQSGALILMEEPETFVSPRSQRRFADFAAKIALKENIKIVATTHSPSIVARFLEDEITLLSRNGHAVSLHAPAPRVALQSRLEIVEYPRQVWFVEDAMAARIASFLAAGFSFHVDVFVAGNDDAVVSLVTTPRAFGDSRVRLIGLLDGDERRRRDNLPASVGYLPSALAPDEFLLDLLAGADRREMAEMLTVSNESLELAMGSIAGLDHHEALHTLRRELEISLDQLTLTLLRWWGKHRADEVRDWMAEFIGVAQAL
ncbi:AAA family ATPase [Luteimonas fraxinea]|uniref:AAA family ATPase n=1 Tax=Luteimonas fraxinea TaxID=2901869 RepID=UPI001E4446A1|nr:AAA family ATPase [Luteimonas fraxinea]MCD9126879.1 ATP-binding protein [Luteimonas fraxinea]